MRAIRIARRILYDLIIPLAVGFALVAVGMYFVLQSMPLVQGVVMMTPSGQQVEVVTDHQIFKDVLQTVLAVAALSIAAFGYGTYRILSSQIVSNVGRDTERRYQMTMAYTKLSFGYIYWLLYSDSDKVKHYLDTAIYETRRAFDEHIKGVYEDDPRFESLTCQIRNNLAYYISEKHFVFNSVNSVERGECLSYVAWLEPRIERYPMYAYQYRDTIDNVRKRFSTFATTKSEYKREVPSG